MAATAPSADLATAETFPLVFEEELVEFACSFSTPVPGDRVFAVFFFFFWQTRSHVGQRRRQSALGLPGGNVAPRAGLTPLPHTWPRRPRGPEATRRQCAPSLLPSVPQFPRQSRLRYGVLMTDHVRKSFTHCPALCPFSDYMRKNLSLTHRWAPDAHKPPFRTEWSLGSDSPSGGVSSHASRCSVHCLPRMARNNDVPLATLYGNLRLPFFFKGESTRKQISQNSIGRSQRV